MLINTILSHNSHQLLILNLTNLSVNNQEKELGTLIRSKYPLKFTHSHSFLKHASQMKRYIQLLEKQSRRSLPCIIFTHRNLWRRRRPNFCKINFPILKMSISLITKSLRIRSISFSSFRSFSSAHSKNESAAVNDESDAGEGKVDFLNNRWYLGRWKRIVAKYSWTLRTP